MTSNEILLVYDKECPVCNAYCSMARIRAAAGELRLVNARDASDMLDEITLRGLDIDQGMVLKLGEKLYYGADAIHALALISSRSGIFNRISYWAFRSEDRARFLYPLLRLCRNLLLKLLGKTKINNLALEDNQRF